MKIYPVKIECSEGDDEELVFKLTTFDTFTATLELNQLISHGNIDELLSKIKEAFNMLDLEK